MQRAGPRSEVARADRPPMMFLGACGSAVSATCMSALRGCMCACVPQALPVRLPRLMVHGATSSEHISH
eukprot:2021601-Prymnesium_polylepis.1